MPKFHQDSIFGPGRRIPMCRERRAQLRAMLRFQRRPGRLTLAALAVGLALADMLGLDGRLDPSLDHLAALARVHLATVKRALVQLRAYGFLTWDRRLVRGAGSQWRVEQTSSAYALSVPAATKAHSAPEVSIKRSSKTDRRPQGGGWAEQQASAARQLAALGFAVPAVWGATG